MMSGSTNFFYRSVFILGFVLGCDSSDKSTPDPLPTTRSGQSVFSAGTQYLDHLPRVSRDGAKALFISGRNDQTLRSFLVTLNDGGASDASRVTSGSNSFDREINHDLLPAGTAALILGHKDNALKLSFFDLAQSSEKEILKGKDVSYFSFSPDGQFIFIAAKESSDTQLTLYLASVSSPQTLKASAAKVALDATFFWGAPTSGYKIYSASLDRLQSLTFASLEEFSSASATDLSTTLPGKITWVEDFGSTLLVGATSTSQDTVGVQGDGNSDKRYRKKTKVFSFTTAAGFQETEPYKSSFFDIQRVFATTAPAALAVGSKPVFCAGDTGDPRIQTYFSFASDLLTKPTVETILLPLTGLNTTTWETSSNLCSKKRADSSVGEFDGPYTDLAVNRGATATQFTALYTSVRNGDAEVRAIRRLSASDTRILSISKNLKP